MGLPEKTSENHTRDKTMKASSWSEKNSKRKKSIPIMIGTKTKVSTTWVNTVKGGEGGGVELGGGL